MNASQKFEPDLGADLVAREVSHFALGEIIYIRSSSAILNCFVTRMTYETYKRLYRPVKIKKPSSNF